MIRELSVLAIHSVVKAPLATWSLHVAMTSLTVSLSDQQLTQTAENKSTVFNAIARQLKSIRRKTNQVKHSITWFITLLHRKMYRRNQLNR